MSKKGKSAQAKHFVFRKHANVGAADATEDKQFLIETFVDNGEIDILRDQSRPECIILGRTGSGKTALIEMLNSMEERIIQIAPESLALTYVSNNDVLNFFIESGVNMDLFYRLLWRHVFAIEIIKDRYQIVNEQSRNDFLTRIRDHFFGNNAKREAIEYLVQWGESFWQETDYRVKEITSKLEKDLTVAVEGVLEGNIPNIVNARSQINADTTKKLSEEQKAEIVRHGQIIVNQVQIKTLSDIMDVLEKDILDDKQKRYYITVDRLDENWVNSNIRLHLIRALIDTVRDFNHKIRNLKIIIAIREDLLDRVFRYTRSEGYQEEKYKSIYLNISWKEDELRELLDRRVHELIKQQYTSVPVSLMDLLPSNDVLKYIFDRTMLRPRDVIMFFNECIKIAEGQAKITQTNISLAEDNYSTQRLRALADEWASDYPNLIKLAQFLNKFPTSFKSREIKDKITERMLDFLSNNPKEDEISNIANLSYKENDIDIMINGMLKILYRVGILGVKRDSFTKRSWSYQGHKLSTDEIIMGSIYYIHPAFWRTLGIRPET